MLQPRALVVEDDPASLEALTEIVKGAGFDAHGVKTMAQARKRLAGDPPDVVILDLELPDGNGIDLLDELDGRRDVDVIFATGQGSIEVAVEAMQSGAVDFMTKPIDPERLRRTLERSRKSQEQRAEIQALRRELRKAGRFGHMTGSSQAIQEVFDLIAKVAPTDATVLITGQTGTGKERVAQTVHELSPRKRSAFVAVNCGAIQPNLIESELFGHEKGAFTGADRRHEGYFERVGAGTLFLDEITEMPLDLQVKLLRVLETGVFQRVGGEEAIECRARVLAASNVDPKKAVDDHKLREDLYYRLNVFPIHVPPLRERPEDVGLLATKFLGELNEEEGHRKRFTGETLDFLRRLAWPGNVRELRNAVRRAFIIGGERIGPDCFLESHDEPTPGRGGSEVRVPLGASIADAEKRLILATLEHCDGDKKRAAKVLGISVKTLYNRLNVYGEQAKS